MIRNIVKIDSEKCTGCGACAEACAEGAIRMIDGKAVLVSDAYCDGLGACLPACPADAISIEKREAVPFEEPPSAKKPETIPMASSIPMAGCSGSGPRRIQHTPSAQTGDVSGQLSQWPVQLRLVPASAPYLENCDLLLASDCSAFACGNFHERFIKGRIVLIGCPKLDPVESWKKLSDIVAQHSIRSITVTRMEVPCCSGLANAAVSAVEKSGKIIPVKVFTVYPDGNVREN